MTNLKRVEQTLVRVSKLVSDGFRIKKLMKSLSLKQ